MNWLEKAKIKDREYGIEHPSDYCKNCKLLGGDGICKYWGTDTYACCFCAERTLKGDSKCK